MLDCSRESGNRSHQGLETAADGLPSRGFHPRNQIMSDTRTRSPFGPSELESSRCVGCGESVAGPRCEHCGVAQRVGTFTVERVIGRTPYSRVYLARGADGRRVALKELLFSMVPDAEQLEAFEREAAMLAQLSHPQIPRFVASFQEGAGAGLRLYLAQEYVDGPFAAREARGPSLQRGGGPRDRRPGAAGARLPALALAAGAASGSQAGEPDRPGRRLDRARRLRLRPRAQRRRHRARHPRRHLRLQRAGAALRQADPAQRPVRPRRVAAPPAHAPVPGHARGAGPAAPDP